MPSSRFSLELQEDDDINDDNDSNDDDDDDYNVHDNDYDDYNVHDDEDQNNHYLANFHARRSIFFMVIYLDSTNTPIDL